MHVEFTNVREKNLNSGDPSGGVIQNQLQPNRKPRRLKKVSYKMHDDPSSDKATKPLSDEEALKKGFNENQGLFLVLGTLYRNSALSWVHTITFLVAGLLMLLCLGRQTVLITDDLSLLFETLHYITIIGGVFVIIPPMMRNKFRYQTIFKAFTVMLLGTFAGFSVLLPGMYIINGLFFAPQRSDGIIMGIPCVIWFPIRVDDDWIVFVRISLLVLEEYAAFTVVAFVVGQQTSAICIGHTLLYEFKVLALTMKKFEQRARKKKHVGKIKIKSDSQTPEYLTACLNDSVKHHDILLEISEQYASIFYVPELVILLSSTIVICLSAISLTSDDIPLEAKAVSVIFTGAEMMNVFVNCYYGQILLDAHDILGDAIYESNWTSYSAIVRHHVLIILSRVQKPLSLSAGGFAAVNLDTFAQVVKSSFSYFSLLQALKE